MALSFLKIITLLSYSLYSKLCTCFIHTIWWVWAYANICEITITIMWYVAHIYHLEKVFCVPLWVGFFFFFNASTLWSNNSTPMYLSRKINTHVHQRTCTLIFMADLFIVSKTQKQFNYLLTGEQMNKSWCVSNITLELSNSNCWHCTQQLKQLILSLHAITWIKHKTIILRTCTHIPCESDLQWYKPGQW